LYLVLGLVFQRYLALPALQFFLTLFGLFFFLGLNLLLNKQHDLEPLSPETLEVEMLDVLLPEEHFPRLLIVVAHLAELLGV